MNKVLTAKAKFYAKELWGVDFDLHIKVNKRFKSTLGRFKVIDDDITIDISAALLDNELLADDILIHELCHWYCYTSGLNFSDGSKDFKRIIRETGATESQRLEYHEGWYLLNVEQSRLNKDYDVYVPYEPDERIVTLNNRFYQEVCKMRNIMITAPTCGKCKIDKIILEKQGLLDKIEILDMADNKDLVAKIGFRSLPMYAVLEEGEPTFKTTNVQEFIDYMR